MKSVINLGIGVLLFLFTIEIVQAIETKSIREEELRQAVTSAVYTALEMSITQPEFLKEDADQQEEENLNKEMKECFLDSMRTLVKSDSDIKITIQKADYKNGILDVYAEAEFPYSNGRTGHICYRKTGIITRYENSKNLK